MECSPPPNRDFEPNSSSPTNFQDTGHHFPDLRLLDADRELGVLRHHLQGLQVAEGRQRGGPLLDPPLAERHQLAGDPLQNRGEVRGRPVQRQVLRQQVVGEQVLGQEREILRMKTCLRTYLTRANVQIFHGRTTRREWGVG